jgi:predicted lipoprotein with Yx(FWY)xxD motif
MNKTPTGGAAVSGAAQVKVGEDPTLGKFLVDEKGMTLYMFTKDSPNQSVCEGNCLATWPPLISSGEATAGPGVTATLGTIQRSDGSTQVTANGMPLYYYKPDTKPGDVSGQGVGEVWYVVAPDGSVVQ